MRSTRVSSKLSKLKKTINGETEVATSVFQKWAQKN